TSSSRAKGKRRGWIRGRLKTTRGLRMTDTYRITKRDAGSGSAGPGDEWGSAVASGDARKLAQLVLAWSGSKPERALSILRDCVSLLEKEVSFSAPAPFPPNSPPVTPGPSRSSCLDAIVVALDETYDGTSWYTSTKELQLASLEFCEACRNHQTLHLKVDPHTPRSLLAAADAPPPHPNRLCPTRVPRLRARRVTWNMPTAAELNVPLLVMAEVVRLEFGHRFNGSLDVVAWPCRLETVEFCRRSTFDQPVEQVAWPVSMQKLTFGALFDQPIEAASFPASLKQLAFGANSLFNQPVGRMEWPTSLQKLTFGQCFDRPVEEVVWPASLLQLTFGNEFNQPVEGTSWPDSLQTLVFGERFNQPVDNVRWPSSLQEVAFGCCEDTWEYR
ncbi:unnamed protein product, partial [Ectocarpus sp. 12 AP-2014]